MADNRWKIEAPELAGTVMMSTVAVLLAVIVTAWAFAA
jgi:hypothetical protein